MRKPTPKLTREAFIWQHSWGANLDAAIVTNADIVARWEVLAAQIDNGAPPAAFAVHWNTLMQTGRPIVPVLRIDGALPANPAPVARFFATLPQAARHALEIDYDSPSNALAQYANFLKTLRAALPQGTQLFATMLPDWLHAADFPAFSKTPDLLILQVHAVQSASRGLFHPNQALAWARRMNSLTQSPFLLAVPDYAIRVQFAAGKTALAAAAEMPSVLPRDAQTIAATPEDAAVLLAGLAQARLSHCIGIVWFRLPLPSDNTGETPATWSIATWRQVALGTPLLQRLSITRAANPAPAPADIILRNTGNTDILAPQTIPLAGCSFFDGIMPYHRAGQTLSAGQRPWIRPGKTLRVGWARCEAQ